MTSKIAHMSVFIIVGLHLIFLAYSWYQGLALSEYQLFDVTKEVWGSYSSYLIILFMMFVVFLEVMIAAFFFPTLYVVEEILGLSGWASQIVTFAYFGLFLLLYQLGSISTDAPINFKVPDEQMEVKYFGNFSYVLDDRRVFWASSFTPEKTNFYFNIVKPNLENFGVNLMRGDEVAQAGGIVEQVWERIVTSRVVVADLSGGNPNVLYELGIAHAVGKPTILLSDSPDLNALPFDIRHHRIFVYEEQNPKALFDYLEASISEVISSGEGSAFEKTEANYMADDRKLVT